MPTFEESIVVDAPRAWLFDLMQDYGRRLEWDEFLSEARLVGGAVQAAVGVRAWCVDTSGRGMETEYVSFQRPKKVAVRMTSGPWMFRSFAGSWGYEEIDAASTRVVFRYHVEGRPRWLAPIADLALRRIFGADMRKRLRSARARLERIWQAERCGPPHSAGSSSSSKRP